MSRYCACIVVLFAVAAIVASGDDLSNDLGEAVVETDRAVTALADIFYMRTSIACKIKCKYSNGQLAMPEVTSVFVDPVISGLLWEVEIAKGCARIVLHAHLRRLSCFQDPKFQANSG